LTPFTFFTHLECASCGMPHSIELRNVCERCGRSLAARYDLKRARKAIHRGDHAGFPGMWRWAALLPARSGKEIVSLGEGGTPLLASTPLARMLGVRKVWIKEEGLNPTGSFKARGIAAAVTMAKALGAEHVGLPTAGNAGGALAAYAARAGLRATIVAPKDTPRANLVEIKEAGARLLLVEGSIADAAARLRKEREKKDIFDLSTLREPYRVEGKKTMGYEIAEALGWKLPSVIVCPCGGGTGILGMWKAFEEMKELGWIHGRFPRMIAAQAKGCAPLVAAMRQETQESSAPRNPRTFASGLRVPKPFADWWILRILRASGGGAAAVSDAEMRRSIRTLTRNTGIFFCPEGAACWPVAQRLGLDRDDEVVIFNTAAGQKYLDVLESSSSKA
jgi:threonine synthase